MANQQKYSLAAEMDKAYADKEMMNEIDQIVATDLIELHYSKQACITGKPAGPEVWIRRRVAHQRLI